MRCKLCLINYDEELSWYFNNAMAELGHRSTYITELHTTTQRDFVPKQRTLNACTRLKVIREALLALPHHDQNVLCAKYKWKKIVSGSAQFGEWALLVGYLYPDAAKDKKASTGALEGSRRALKDSLKRFTHAYTKATQHDDSL